MGLWDIDKIEYVGRGNGPVEGLGFQYYDADKHALAGDARVRPICPTGAEHLILPLLHQRGRAVPVERELEHQAVRAISHTLLLFHIDMEIRVQRIHVTHHQVELRFVLRALHERRVEISAMRVAPPDAARRASGSVNSSGAGHPRLAPTRTGVTNEDIGDGVPCQSHRRRAQ